MTSQNDDDQRAFREAMRGTRPLSSDRAQSDVPKPPPSARFRRRDDREVLHESLHGDHDPGLLGSGDELFFARPELPRSVVTKLKRGKYRLESELDLHGLTADEAREAIDEYLVECRRHGWRCVRIIHGKGNRSGHAGPVLKPGVARWLRKREAVQAYASARPTDGGTGALYVLLRF